MGRSALPDEESRTETELDRKQRTEDVKDANVRQQIQHTVRKVVEHERRGSVGGGRRRADVRITLISPMRSVAERTKEWNSGDVARVAKKGHH